MKKLNRKGYLAIEIVLASVVAFAIAFFLIEITIKLVNKTDDSYVDTVFLTDKALIIKNIQELIKEGGSIQAITKNNDNCYAISYSAENVKLLRLDPANNKITFGSPNANPEYSKEIDNKLTVQSLTLYSESNNNNIMLFKIEINNKFSNQDYSIIIPIVNGDNITIGDTTPSSNPDSPSNPENPNPPVESEYIRVEISMQGRYGNYSDTISFKKNEEAPIVDLYERYDQIFQSYTNEIDLTCYTDSGKTMEYRYYSLDTIRTQGLTIEFSNLIPEHLYCDAVEIY